MDEIDLSRYNAAVSRIRGLTERWLEAGVDLFLALREIETDGAWKAPGHATFVDFLKEEFPTALGIERYTNVMRAVELYGEEFVRRVGILPCRAISQQAIAEDPKRVDLVKQTVQRHIQKHGCAPDDNTVRDFVRGIAPELVKPHSTTREVVELEELRVRVREANAKIRKLEKDLKDARGEIEKLTRRAEKAEALAKRSVSARKNQTNGKTSQERQ